MKSKFDIVSRSQMRIIEKIGAEDQKITYEGLMKNAGEGAYEIIKEKFDIKDKSFLVFVDKGNNGGDALIICNKLLNDTDKLKIVFTSPREDMEEQLQRIRETLPNFKMTIWEELKEEKEQYDFIIDGIYGTGFRGNLSKRHKEICRFINENSAYKISLDLPSGTVCDSGRLDEDVVRADLTICFHAKKPCHILEPSRANSGEIVVCPIGINDKKISFDEDAVYFINRETAEPLLPKKSELIHKGRAGRVMIIGGKRGMTGSVAMAALAALRCGCGYVNVCVTKEVYRIISPILLPCVFTILPENEEGGISGSATTVILKELFKADSVVIGCGMGVSDDTREIVKTVCASFEGKIVIDADGINCAKLRDIKQSKAEIILTPHYKEIGVLIGKDAKFARENRVELARKISNDLGITVLLKSYQTVIAHKDGRLYICDRANGGMAKAGSGDVLSGIIGALSSQGECKSAILGCYIHSRAGELARERHTAYSMQPTDVISEIENVFKELIAD